MTEQIYNIHPNAFEIKKQCILTIAYMVLKVIKNHMEDDKYIKDEYQFVEHAEATKDLSEKIIETIMNDVIETQRNKEKNNTAPKIHSFWDGIF